MFAFFGIVLEWLSMPLVFYSVCLVLLLSAMLSTSSMDDVSHTGISFWQTIASLALLFVVGYHFGLTWSSVKQNPLLDVVAVLSYFVVGTLWSFTKWYLYLLKVKTIFLQIRDKYIDGDAQGTQNPDRTIRAYDAALYNKLRVYTPFSIDELEKDPSLVVLKFKPLASAHKASIIEWLAFWPVSVCYTLLDDPLRKIVNYLFLFLRTSFQRLSDKMFSNF